MSVPSMGLDPTTPRLRVALSATWAGQAPRKEMCKPLERRLGGQSYIVLTLSHVTVYLAALEEKWAQFLSLI